jgi:hypothetical protein
MIITLYDIYLRFLSMVKCNIIWPGIRIPLSDPTAFMTHGRSACGGFGHALTFIPMLGRYHFFGIFAT